MIFLSPQGVGQETFGPRTNAADMGMTEAEKKAAQRMRARAAGLCGVCRKAKPRKGYLTCVDCIEAAKERYRRRKRSRKKR